MHVERNDFKNNIAPNTIFIDNAWQQTDPANYSLYMKHNNFLNPGNIEIYNNVQYGNQDFYLDSNYWGSTNPQHCDSVIYDYFDFANQSVVYYLPMLSAAVVVDTMCSSIPNSIADLNLSKSEFLLFPNPANDFINVIIPILNSQVELKFYSTTMQLVKTIIANSGNETSISVSDLQPGIYFIDAQCDSQHWRQNLSSIVKLSQIRFYFSVLGWRPRQPHVVDEMFYLPKKEGNIFCSVHNLTNRNKLLFHSGWRGRQLRTSLW
ncbi:MAG: T9SS type A sorting domain-containing protein [Bacteroidetes bacterium]|nr:T9SS type A sorting domain-containing protein [Bacteroidota bacterium]